MKIQLTLAMAGLAMLSSMTGFSQESANAWSKTYAVTGEPALAVQTSGANVSFTSCGKCHEIKIHVEMMGRKLSDYRLDQGQNGNEVHFIFKELPHDTMHILWHREPTHVIVETPAQLTLHATTSDGNVSLSGLQGVMGLINSDGDVTFDHVSGDRRITSDDGDVQVTDSEGALSTRTSDGNVAIEDRFHVFALRDSDGAIALTLSQGTKLTEASNIQSSDGTATIQVPRTFVADLDVHASDGSLELNLPLTLEHERPAVVMPTISSER